MWSHLSAERERRETGSSGFTLVELLVVISVIALLMAILLPALGKARDAARKVQCGSNERQIGVVMAGYATENRDYIPPGQAPTSGWSGYGAGNDAPTAWMTAGSATLQFGIGSLMRWANDPNIFFDPAWTFANGYTAKQEFTIAFTSFAAWKNSTSASTARSSYLYRPVPYPKAGSNPTTVALAWTRLRSELYGSSYVSAACWSSNQNNSAYRAHDARGSNYLYHDGHANWLDDRLNQFYDYPSSAGDESSKAISRKSDTKFFRNADLK